MKRVRTINGVMRINYYNDNELMQKVQDVLTDHRATLINRLLSGLNDYVDYKFRQKIDVEQAQRIRDRLLSLRNSPVILEDHAGVMDHLREHDLTVLSSTKFYEEIDTSIQYLL